MMLLLHSAFWPVNSVRWHSSARLWPQFPVPVKPGNNFIPSPHIGNETAAVLLASRDYICLLECFLNVRNLNHRHCPLHTRMTTHIHVYSMKQLTHYLTVSRRNHTFMDALRTRKSHKLFIPSDKINIYWKVCLVGLPFSSQLYTLARVHECVKWPGDT